MSKQKQRVAIYARVSTTEGKQTPENQLRQLRTYAKARDFTIRAEYIDHATGRNEKRPEYQKLLDSIRKRQADVALGFRCPMGLGLPDWYAMKRLRVAKLCSHWAE